MLGISRLKGMFMLKKCKYNLVSEDILNLVYNNAFVLPHLAYCNVGEIVVNL